jgi:hypothetical protein
MQDRKLVPQNHDLDILPVIPRPNRTASEHRTITYIND